MKTFENAARKGQESFPPWHPARQMLTSKEVPVYLRKVYGVQISAESVKKWRLKGITTKDGYRIKLHGTRIGLNLFFQKKDIQAFLEG